MVELHSRGKKEQYNDGNINADDLGCFWFVPLAVVPGNKRPENRLRDLTARSSGGKGV
jgi:hypothetical protein